MQQGLYLIGLQRKKIWKIYALLDDLKYDNDKFDDLVAITYM